jgi:hypothetical protein
MEHLTNFTHLVWYVLGGQPCLEHRRLLLSQPATLQAVTDLLLRHGVPGFAAAATCSSGRQGSSGGVRLLDTARPGLECMSVLEALFAVLSSSATQPAVASYLRQPGGAACLQHAISIAAALPASLPRGLDPARFAAAHSNAANLISALCTCMAPPEPPAAGGRDGSCGGAEETAAAWQIVCLVPRMAAALDSLLATAGSCPLKAQASLAATCFSWATAVDYTSRLHSSNSPATPEQLQDWVAAVQASTRLLHALAQLDTAWYRQQQLGPEVQDGALRLVAFLLLTLWSGMPVSLRAPAGAGRLVAQPEQLWQLHSSCCRVVHWLRASQPGALLICRLGDISSSGQPGLGAPGASSGGWRHLMQGFDALFIHIWGLTDCGPPGAELQPEGVCVYVCLSVLPASKRVDCWALGGILPPSRCMNCTSSAAG